MRIAILEDDRSQLELLTHWLTLAEHHAVSFERGEDLMVSITQERFEMLILDWNLPDASGIDILTRVRQTAKVGCYSVQRAVSRTMWCKPYAGGRLSHQASASP